MGHGACFGIGMRQRLDVCRVPTSIGSFPKWVRVNCFAVNVAVHPRSANGAMPMRLWIRSVSRKMNATIVTVPTVNMPLPMALREAPFAAERIAKGDELGGENWTCDKQCESSCRNRTCDAPVSTMRCFGLLSMEVVELKPDASLGPWPIASGSYLIRLGGWARVESRREGCPGFRELELSWCCCSWTRCLTAAETSLSQDVPRDELLCDCSVGVVLGIGPGRILKGVRNSAYAWNNARLISLTRIVRAEYRASTCGVGASTVMFERITEMACSSMSRSFNSDAIFACDVAHVVAGGISSRSNSLRLVLCCSEKLIWPLSRKACECWGWFGCLMSIGESEDV